MKLLGQSTRQPFYCSRCGRLYDKPEQLISCLAEHEAGDRYMDHVQSAHGR